MSFNSALNMFVLWLNKYLQSVYGYIAELSSDLLRLQTYFDAAVNDSSILKSCAGWNLNPFALPKLRHVIKWKSLQHVFELKTYASIVF